MNLTDKTNSRFSKPFALSWIFFSKCTVAVKWVIPILVVLTDIQLKSQN